MKKANNFIIIKTISVLTEKEQSECRVLLKDMLKQQGIISLCLDNENLFVEYNPEILNVENIYQMMENVGFPADNEIANVA